MLQSEAGELVNEVGRDEDLGVAAGANDVETSHEEVEVQEADALAHLLALAGKINQLLIIAAALGSEIGEVLDGLGADMEQVEVSLDGVMLAIHLVAQALKYGQAGFFVLVEAIPRVRADFV